MRHVRLFVAALGVCCLAATVGAPPRPAPSVDENHKPVPAFVQKGMAWLAEAQLENGGWGAGMHARQEIRDPHAVQVDPATTAFAAMALMRSGSTLTDGPYHDNVRRALDYLLALVEAAPEAGAKISDVTGTQPQAKLGQHIDVSMVAQFLTKALPLSEADRRLYGRIGEALEVCVTKLARAQDADGSWNAGGGWAGVLQSSMANNALEMAQDADIALDEVVVTGLARSREYQKQNLDDESGDVRTESAAGIPLYTIASNQRATAKEAREAEAAVAEGARDGRLDDGAEVSEEALRRLGYDENKAANLAEAYRKNRAASAMLQSDDVLSGFGNNGGEEFLSYMMTSEALAAQQDEAWEAWYKKMHTRLEKVQNPDGSWSGHHCITSPVFCTAAVILTMTADQAGV